jgi:hypothetical protein
MIKNLVKRDNYARGASLQERADLLRLYLLTGARQVWPHPQRLEDLDSLPRSLEQRALVKGRVKVQATTLLDRWLSEQPPAQLPDNSRTPLSDERRKEVEAERAAQVLAAQERAFGFSLRVAPSTAGRAAGRGVFISGQVPPGSVIALYPGVTFDPFEVMVLPGGTRRFAGNEHLMARHDKCLVDASAQALACLPSTALANPLAVAHTVNHPPEGQSPNVVPAAVDWDSSVPDALVPLLPNVRFATAASLLLAADHGRAERTDGHGQRFERVADLFRASLADARPAEPEEGPTLRGLLLVTSRLVEDEELFLNYRLNPRNGYPPWYAPVDAEEDARRWES